MGGGVGLAFHGPIRVVTEKTRFAMPEMAIGLFPDVGATQLLSRLQGCVGRFLAMTGTTLAAYDCLRAGLATHFVASASLPRLKKALCAAHQARVVGPEALRLCEEVLADFKSEPLAKDAILIEENQEVIKRCFGAPSVEEKRLDSPRFLCVFRQFRAGFRGDSPPLEDGEGRFRPAHAAEALPVAHSMFAQEAPQVMFTDFLQSDPAGHARSC